MIPVVKPVCPQKVGEAVGVEFKVGIGDDFTRASHNYRRLISPRSGMRARIHVIPPLVAPSAGSCAPFHLLERSDYAVFPPHPQERPPRSWRRWSQAIDSTTAMGRPIIQMASAFGEQERQIIRSRVNAGLERVRVQGTSSVIRKRVSPKIEDAIRSHLSAGNGILKVAALVGVGSGTVQRVKREMLKHLEEAA